MIGVATVLTVGALQASATALTSADLEQSGSSSAALRVAPKVMKSMTITKDGTVVNGARVRGSIAIKADNVTIKNTTVRHRGYHSIRIFPGARGTRILRTTVNCQRPRTNGIVFGNYVAKRVRVNNCRHDFKRSARKPAKVRNSWIDGVPFETRASRPKKQKVTSTSGPSGSARPSASNTGVPTGTSLRAASGMTITRDGTVVDGLHIRGSVTISADNVTIRNSLVQSDTSLYPIQVTDGATGALIEDVEVDNLGSDGIGILFSGGSSGTVRRANVHSAEDGIRIQSDDVTVEYSYVHDLQRYSGGHHDSIQIRRGDNVTLRGNTLLPYVESTNDPMNAALQIGSLLDDDPISNLRVIGNYMNGGNFTINGGSSGDIDSALYSGNRFGRDFRYGVSGNINSSSTWDSTNVWDDTGASVR